MTLQGNPCTQTAKHTAALVPGVLIGAAVGLLDGGGSVLTVPVFVYVPGFEPKAAIAMSLAVVGVTSALGTASHWRAGNVNGRVALVFGGVAMLGTLLGVRLSQFVPGARQLVIFGVVMLAAAVFMLRGRAPCEQESGTCAASPVVSALKVVPGGLSVGVLTGIFGVGADEIIEAQRKEIAEMKYLIRAVEREGVQVAGRPASQAEQASASEAVRTADLATTDLEPITDAELQRMLGSGPVCRFAYGPDEAAVAVATSPAAGASRGVIKLHGRLVAMTVRYPSSPAEGFELSNEDVSVTAAPFEAQVGNAVRDADARLRVGKDLDAGYAGFYGCTSSR